MFSHVKAVTCGRDLLVLKDRQAILSQAPLLQELAERCGQPGAMHWLDYFLHPRVAARKPPYLVLQLSESAHFSDLGVDNVRAAALFFEYRICGLRTRAFSTDDSVGFRTVIAPAHQRRAMATRAAKALIDLGAHLVLATYESPEPPDDSVAAPPAFADLLTGTRHREVGRFLELGPTFDDTLARLGRLTRRNIRYYRRRFEARVSCQLLPDVRPHLTLDELRAFNRQCINPVPDEEIDLRWRTVCISPESFTIGLRTAAGEWLSIAAGWRHGSTTVLHWQMNAAGYEHHSICTVMRSFFLEHEVQAGARRLLMYGGTPHSMHHSFLQETIGDVIVCRPTVRAGILRLLARTVSSPRGLIGRSNYLAQALRDIPLHLAASHAESSVNSSATQLGQPRGAGL